MRYSLNALSRLTIKTICLFTLFLHVSLSTRIQNGPMSELAGSAAQIDTILSPGSPSNTGPPTLSINITTINFISVAKEARPSAEAVRRSFVPTPTTPPPIPPSPFVSAASRDVSASFTLPSNFQRANSITPVNSINFNTTAYQLPGRHLMVLPVGLIIYGAFSSAALVMVMMVTYERIQYRRQFRNRLKEQMANPANSYGNFSDRRV